MIGLILFVINFLLLALISILYFMEALVNYYLRERLTYQHYYQNIIKINNSLLLHVEVETNCVLPSVRKYHVICKVRLTCLGHLHNVKRWLSTDHLWQIRRTYAAMSLRFYSVWTPGTSARWWTYQYHPRFFQDVVLWTLIICLLRMLAWLHGHH